ncbi:uncharacterized protein [Oscarella lobularis]|uniref:uncharacterized protein n=1 Tax=Oscarella lobularis TaxID=121494 RepID=UPI0033130BD5
MATFAIFSVLVAFLVAVRAHPTYYEVDERYLQPGALPPFNSYHIHVMFVNGNNESIKAAMEFHDEFVEKFNLTGTKPCTGNLHQGRLCMFEVEVQPSSDSPFISGQWAAFVPLEDFQRCVPWTMQNRKGLDIFVHPNSGKGLDDHTLWPLWGGMPWPINVAAFST